MRKRSFRKTLLSQVAAIAAAAGVAAGCSADLERFADGPVYTGGTSNQRTILGQGRTGQPTYDDILRGPGGTVAALPPAGSQPRTTGSVTAPSRRDVSATALPPVQAASAPAPVPATVTAAGGENSWRGWSAAGGTRVQARDGDTVKTMAHRYGVPEQAVLAANGFDGATVLRPGQSVVIPTYVAASDSSQPVRLPPAGGAPVATGSIAPQQAPAGLRTAAVPARKPTSATRVAAVQSPATRSDAVRAAPAPVADLSPQRAAGNGATRTVPGVPAATASVEPAAASGPVQVAAVEPADAAGGPMFRWPVRGRIISDFGTKPGGTRNDGINLAVPEGTPVKAAGDGSVIYAGNELKGYGNLVLIRHSDGWVSAYAHNSELSVKRGDTVQRGQVVAKAGATGSVSQPQVHFELRQGNKPVDPLKYLPKD
ncbi:M23 family metallopeptidase [Polymorphum gilvum]|uniref:M23 peptidase domain protein n=1 Tax=Polymorphum gilvum (strain LMG 25793 / CGMCC 1.9160 / SL003B-26A1) TaxID=991905 RepID=F2IZ11_POLGS|nr:M23 family metallopeptidase [Polymorphum gilvum]ADZ70626.1 M23 peptidase domain protein [Polymorphum gilvum SL003B-26A1]